MKADNSVEEPILGPNKKRRRIVQRIERALRHYVTKFRSNLKEHLLTLTNLEALKFYREMTKVTYLPDDLIDIVPKLRLLYVAVPKAASSRIHSSLALMLGNDLVTGWRSDKNRQVHDRGVSGFQAPRHAIIQFHKLATDSRASRFTFVRNPYARLLSCWTDQYRDLPLIPGKPRAEVYLAYRAAPAQAIGADATLSNANYVEFACATANQRIDRHWQLQSDIINLPGVHWIS